LCAQLVHVAGESNPQSKHAYAVALWTSPKNLESIEEKLIACGVTYAAIREPDEPYNNQLMGIGIEPCDRSINKDLRRIVSGLKLIRGPSCTM
jgi:hypothetical protein